MVNFFEFRNKKGITTTTAATKKKQTERRKRRTAKALTTHRIPHKNE